MKRTGNSVATKSRRRSPTARRRLTRMIGITASPSGAPGPWPARRSRARSGRGRGRARRPTTPGPATAPGARTRPGPSRSGVPRLSTWRASGRAPGGSRLPPSSASTRPTTREAANASWGVRANEVRKAPRPHMAAVAPTHIMSTPSGAPQLAPKAAAVTPQTIRMEVSPVRPMARSFPHTMALGLIGRGGQPGQRPGGALQQERAHAEAAPDEEEDHGDGGREVVEHGLAAVAERARRDRDGRRVGGRPGAPAGRRRAGWPGPPPPTRRTPGRAARWPGPRRRTPARAWRPAPPSG